MDIDDNEPLRSSLVHIIALPNLAACTGEEGSNTPAADDLPIPRDYVIKPRFRLSIIGLIRRKRQTSMQSAV
jgi:Flp pilus assembly secretin CpaC